MSKSVFFTKKRKRPENGAQNIMVINSVVVHGDIFDSFGDKSFRGRVMA